MSDLRIAELQASRPGWSVRRARRDWRGWTARKAPVLLHAEILAGLAEAIEQGEMPIGDRLLVQQVVQP
jgi:hypothetical protein